MKYSVQNCVSSLDLRRENSRTGPLARVNPNNVNCSIIVCFRFFCSRLSEALLVEHWERKHVSRRSVSPWLHSSTSKSGIACSRVKRGPCKLLVDFNRWNEHIAVGQPLVINLEVHDKRALAFLHLDPLAEFIRFPRLALSYDYRCRLEDIEEFAVGISIAFEY